MPYWAELWPSGVFLAAAVGERDLRRTPGTRARLRARCPERRRRARRRRRAGNGLGARGARGHAPERGAERRRVSTLLADWSRRTPGARARIVDLVLCSDVLYEPRNVDALLDLLPQLTGEVLAQRAQAPARGALLRARRAAVADRTRRDVNVLRRLA